jgi:hypothetical protein
MNLIFRIHMKIQQKNRDFIPEKWFEHQMMMIMNGRTPSSHCKFLSILP